MKSMNYIISVLRAKNLRLREARRAFKAKITGGHISVQRDGHQSRRFWKKRYYSICCHA